MIAELDRYQGIVLRQIVVAHGGTLNLGVADLSGRKDAYHIDGAAFQIKHSSKRLSPWQFTYMPENLAELTQLRQIYDSVWAFLVCGQDGVVGVSYDELASIALGSAGAVTWVRISRDRRSMYRVWGSSGELPRAKPRGVQAFLEAIAAKR